MELTLFKRGEFDKIFLACFSEKKLTKNIINNVDINHTVQCIKKTDNSLTLRSSGQLVIGILRIFLRKHLILISELEEFMQNFYDYQQIAQKIPTHAPVHNITLQNKKRVVPSIDDTFSASSYLQSTRGSMEVGRNTANPQEITLAEINYTPRSQVPSIHDLEFEDNLIENITPAGDIFPAEPTDLPTPSINLSTMTPGTVKRALRYTPSKYKAKIDKDTYEEYVQDSRPLTKQHNRYQMKKINLDSLSLFIKPIIYLPPELKELYTPGLYNTRITDIQEELPMDIPIEQDYIEPQIENEPYIEPEIPKQDLQQDSQITNSCIDLLSNVKQVRRKNINFSQLCPKEREGAARAFYDLMILSSKSMVSISQKGDFKDILIKI